MMRPRLSVVIPVLDRYEQLARALDRLRRQDYRGPLEVFVVSDAAEPRPDRITELVCDLPFQCRHLRASVPGAASARDTGWRAADSDLVVFLDGDVLASRSLLREHLEWHESHPDAEIAVLGPVRWADELRVSAFMRWVERGVQFNYHTIRGTEAGWGHFVTTNVSTKRALLERVGGFDFREFPFLYEDVDLAYRMHKVGLRVLFNRKALGEHLHQVTVEGYRRRMAKVAPAELRFVTRHPEVPPFFFNLFSEAAKAPPARGWLGRRLNLIPESIPWLKERAWRSADSYFRQQLAPPFLEAWREASSGL
jgi:GT2 family glycosyltransferase